jgi:hypothetical protein
MTPVAKMKPSATGPGLAVEFVPDGVLNNSREDMEGSGLFKRKRGFAEPECG